MRALNFPLGLHEGSQRHALCYFLLLIFKSDRSPEHTVSEQRGLGVISLSPDAASSLGGLRLAVTS